jgi:hypothetical protein
MNPQSNISFKRLEIPHNVDKDIKMGLEFFKRFHQALGML